MKKSIISVCAVLALLCVSLLFPVQGFGQTYTRAVIASTLSPGPTGLGSTIIYGAYYQAGQSPVIPNDGEVDSAFAAINSGGRINGLQVWQASEVIAYDSTSLKAGRSQTYVVAGESQLYFASSNLLKQYTTSYFTPVFFQATVDVTAANTAPTIVGIPQAPFVVTGIYVVGSNDTTGYTSNAILAFGTNTTYFNNLAVGNTVPALGTPTLTAPALVTPRILVPAGTAIKVRDSVAAVATTEHARIVIYGNYIH